MTDDADFDVLNHGASLLLLPLTGKARAWCLGQIPSDVPQWGGGYLINPPEVPDILDAALDDGLRVSTGGASRAAPRRRMPACHNLRQSFHEW
jgi:hypothetical protein